MPKIRDRSIDKAVQAFAAGADRPTLPGDNGHGRDTAAESEADAPRGKRNGGQDKLIPLNAYEAALIVKAARQEGRKPAAFMRNAAVARARETLGHKGNERGQ